VVWRLAKWWKRAKRKPEAAFVTTPEEVGDWLARFGDSEKAHARPAKSIPWRETGKAPEGWLQRIKTLRHAAGN